MSKNWGKTPVTNADNRVGQTQVTYLAPSFGPNGESIGYEERIDRRPLGKAERFVDPQGNIVNLQMYTPGDPHRAQTEISKRAALHKKGFIEFAKCPLKHGTKQHAAREFSKMPAEYVVNKGLETERSLEIPATECDRDPRVMSRRDGDLYAETACPHMEWLISYRRDQQTDAVAKRSAHTVEAKRREQEERDLKRAQAELLKEQLAERRARKPKSKEVTE